MDLSKFKVKPDLFDSKLVSEKIADVLRENIISGNIQPGEKIGENQVAEALNISRPPVREAFRILSTEGLITLVPRKGAFVTKFSIEEVKEIYEIKSMMEGLAARLAIPIITEKKISDINSISDLMEKKIKDNNFREIQNLNIKFHRKIIEMSENKRLVNLYQSIILPVRRYQRLGLSAPLSWKTSLLEHKSIVEAIRSKNIELAERLIREHTMSATSRVIERIRKTG